MLDRKTRLTITGFGPFHCVNRNCTEVLITHLACRPDLADRFELSTKVFPVIYENAEITLRSLIDATAPDILILTGVAQEISELHLEQFAHNLDNSPIADNHGVIRIKKEIDAHSKVEKYRCQLPVEDFAAQLRQSGIATSVSTDAGGYICNHFYFVASQIGKFNHHLKALLFVHIPVCINNKGSLNHSISIETAVDGISQLAYLIDDFIERTG